MPDHVRAKIQLNSLNDLNKFVHLMAEEKDTFFVEDFNARNRVNAASLLGMIYMTTEYKGDMFLVNESHDGVFPAYINDFRPL